MEIKAFYKKFKDCTAISTDTRKLKKDAMYFALKGEKFNGNEFVEQALNLGAKYCVVDEKNAVINDRCILVNNTLNALQKLSNFHRHQINISIIALTGSNGKTTTKELINTVLSSKYNVKCTEGNYNNHIGVPLTLLSFDENLDFGIVEMGANHQKEIAFLCDIAEPDFGLITNFGKAHLEGFGGVEGVIKGKSEMYDYLKAHDKTAFINNDDVKQVKQIKPYKKIVTFGEALSNDYTISFVDANPFVKLKFLNTTINTQLIGSYNFANIAIAMAIGQYFSVETDLIKKSIEHYTPKNNRSEIKKIKTNSIILDAYNANPTSMLAALENFYQLKDKNKMIIIGDMLELGEAALDEHQKMIKYIENHFSEHVFTVGKHFYNTHSKDFIKKYKSFEDLIHANNFKDLKQKSILIKGSRGIALERILEELT